MKNSQVLRKARVLLERGEFRYAFVCWAIGNVAGASSKQKDQLRGWVMGLLDGHVSYGEWLREHDRTMHSIGKRQRNNFLSGRLQWMDWMIRHWESQGK